MRNILALGNVEVGLLIVQGIKAGWLFGPWWALEEELVSHDVRSGESFLLKVEH